MILDCEWACFCVFILNIITVLQTGIFMRVAMIGMC